MKIEKIDDRAKAQPVDDVADRAADDQPDRDGEKRVATRLSQNSSTTMIADRGEREDQRIEPGAVEQAEADPGVIGQDEVEKRGDRAA